MEPLRQHALRSLVRYTVPEWAKPLAAKAPSHRVRLAMTPTPIQPMLLPGMPAAFTCSIKRDDMTGSLCSGNKIRKLEFILAHALESGCDTVLTCGGLQSNHCRATAVAARELGMHTHLFLRSASETLDDAQLTGNTFLDKMVGADIHLVPKKAKYEEVLLPAMRSMQVQLHAEGHKSLIIPVGGSDTTGVWGYLQAWDELLGQNIQSEFTDIVTTCGSGGTASGLALGNWLTGSKLRVHAIAVCDDETYFYDHIDETIEGLGLAGQCKARDIVRVVEGYKGLGYGESTAEELAFIAEVGRCSGQVFDPVYTGKAVRGLVAEMQSRPDGFQGRRVLFVHTGGVFGLLDGRFAGMHAHAHARSPTSAGASSVPVSPSLPSAGSS